MKKKLFYSALIMGVLFITGCRNELAVGDSPAVSESDALADLMSELETMNSKFISGNLKPKGALDNLLLLLNDEELLDIQPSVPFYPESYNCVDADVFAYKMALSFGYSVGRSVNIAVRASVMCEEELRKSENLAFEPDYFRDVNGYIQFRPKHIDYMYPVNEAVVRMGTHSAYQAGVLHNEAILMLHEINPDFAVYDPYDLSVQISEVVADMGLDLTSDPVDDLLNVLYVMPDLMLPITPQKYAYLNQKYDIGDEVIITSKFMNEATKYSGATMRRYADTFASVVEASNISAYSKKSILGAISIAVNSRALWNMELPNPMETNLFLCISRAPNSEALSFDILTTSQLITKMSTPGDHLWGIPKFDRNGELLAALFYPDCNDYLPVNTSMMSHFFAGRTHYRIPSTVSISNSNTQNNPRISDPVYILRRNYPVYALDEAPNVYVMLLELE